MSEDDWMSPYLGRVAFGFGIAMLAIYGGSDPGYIWGYIWVTLGIAQVFVGAYYGWPNER